MISANSSVQGRCRAALLAAAPGPGLRLRRVVLWIVGSGEVFDEVEPVLLAVQHVLQHEPGRIRDAGSRPVWRSKTRPMGMVMSIVPSIDVFQSRLTFEPACQLSSEDIVASRLRNQIRCAPLGPPPAARPSARGTR